MATEAAAFLKEKLQSLLDGGGTVFPGLEVKIIDAIGKLGQLSHHHHHLKDGDEVRKVLTSIHGLEDAIDTYLIRRIIRRRQPPRWRRRRWWWIGGDSAASTNNFPALLIHQMYLRQGITKFLKEVKTVVVAKVDSVGGPSSCWLTDQTRGRGLSCDMEEEIRKKEVEDLVSQLITDNHPELLDRDNMRVLTVVGSSGHGKTELVRSAYNSTKVKRHFQYRAWVSVDSKQVEEDSAFFRHVMVDLIHQGTMSRSTDLDHMEETGLQDMLFKMLMEKKTYLIVFDNVCSCEAWAKLVVPIPSDSQNGSRVLVTTRAAEVANFVDPLNPPTLMLGKLTCQGSWQLLLKQVNPNVLSLNYDNLKEIVMRKCCGISMAITMLGGVLYNTQLSEWEGVINDVPDMEDDETSSRVVANMFDFSFRALHDPVLKACLIYMVLFPEEVEIPVRRLHHLWLAEGFFLNTTLLRPEDAAQICLEELINRKLIEVTKWKLDRSPKSCRIHGFIRDILVLQQRDRSSSVQADVHREPIGSSQQQTRCCSTTTGSSRRFVDHYSSSNNMNSVLLPDQSQTNSKKKLLHHLHSYLSFNTLIRGTPNTDIGNFLKVMIRKSRTGFGLLRVLDLEGVYKPFLPDTIGTLVLLKYLGLRSTVLDSIPESICKLPLLETLDLKHTNVNTLPTSVWESKTLRHLYINEIRLDGSGSSSTTTTTTSTLTNFQTLRGIYIVDKKVVSNVLDRFTALRKVGITGHKDSIDQVTKWISGLSHLETLKLRSLDRLGKPSHLDLAAQLNLESKKILKL